MYVCLCKSVRLADTVERAKVVGCSADDLVRAWGLDEIDACGNCVENIEVLSFLVEAGLNDLETQKASISKGRKSPPRTTVA